MAEKLPEGVADLDAYLAEKSQASLEMANILEEINFPDNDFEVLLASDRETLNGYRESLYNKMEELALDDEGNVKNDSRYVVEFIGQRLAVLDELLSLRSSEDKAAKIFAMKEAA